MSKAVGIVLDISLRHDENDRRIADVVKDQLVQFVKTFDDDDYFYVFHDESLKTFYRRGQQIYTISKYQPSDTGIDLMFALKQTLYILAAEDEDYDRFLYWITDRPINDSYLKKIKNVNEKDGYKVIVSVLDLKLFNAYELADYLTGVHDDHRGSRQDIHSSSNS